MPRRASKGKNSSRRKKSRRRRFRPSKPFIISVTVLILAAIIVTGIFLIAKYKKYTGYKTVSVIPMSNSEENTEYYVYGRGYLKCAGDGLTYFGKDGVMWGENYSMLQPVIDICGEYVAVADMGQRNVYLYDRVGYVNRLNLSHDITDVEISGNGLVAVASSDSSINYLEVMDRDGNEIMTQKSVFSATGFLMDISISEDGSKLAAVFVSIDKGTLRSKVVFYDLSGNLGDDVIAGTFDHYESVLLTTVHFMEKNKVCAVGDAGFTIFDFSESPEIVYEDLEFSGEIESLFFDSAHIGMVTQENESEHRYYLKVFDLAGNYVLNMGTDFSYNRADFAGNNVLLYSYNECLMYSFAGVEKF